MSASILISILAALFYGGAGMLAWRNHPRLPWVALSALMFHAAALSLQLLGHGALHIGMSEALSLFAWQSAALLWAFSWREPVATNGALIYPVAALFGLAAALWPSPPGDVDVLNWKISLHILISLLSAGVLTLAAVQALALAIQERLLRRHRSGRIGRHLPPLQMLERLLFQMVGIGFGLLSLTLLTGLWFIDNWLAQHLAHKTILSIVAWLVFGVLLWGRWRHGWRGRIAIRWALSGYGILILAYFGTKLVLELVLQKHWLMTGT